MIWLADGRREHDWAQTAGLMALLANCHRDPKKRREPYAPDDFNPLVERKPPEPASIEVLKQLVPQQTGKT